MRISHPFTNTNLTHKITFLSTTLAILPLVAFLFLTLAPAPVETSASATSETSEVAVGVNETLSLRVVEYNESTGQWDIDTNEISTDVEHGSFATASVKVIASTNGAGGYVLSLSDTDNNNALTSPRILDTIPSLSESKTLDNLTDTTEKFPEERWGYSWAKNSDTPSLTFDSVPLNDASASVKQKDSTGEKGTNDYLFTLGVRVSTDTTAETYSDQVMFSLVGNPAPDSPLFYRTEYMQNFTQTICNTVKTPLATTTEVTTDNGYDYNYSGDHATKVPSTKVKDKRDEQEYTIRKLADGNCWMTENLRFGATTNTTADTPNPWSSTTDPTTNTATTSAGASVLADSTNGLINTHIITAATSATGADGSAAFGDTAEYYTKPYIAIVSANTTDNVSGTGTKFGALYNYCAATGGTACTASGTTPTVSGSICPTGWKLPSFDAEVGTASGTNASYNNLTATYGISKDTAAGVTAIIASPLSFPRAGGFGGGALYDRSASGGGSYWSSTPSGGANAFYLYFGSTSSIHYNGNFARRYGRSVRCVLAP